METIPPSPATKFRPPSAAGRLVDRERLLDILRRGQERRLTLIHAPAGFGKSTLAAQWSNCLTAQGLSVAWVSVDGDDGNPLRLLTHLIEAVRSVRPDLTMNPLDLLDLVRHQADDADRHVLTALINNADASDDPLVVVVDDWHRVSDPRARAAMEFLLDSASPMLRLVITSRSRGGLPLGRLRVRDQLVEVDESLMRFNRTECGQLLVDINGLTLSETDLADLIRTTDGWVAALQLASLSLRGRPDRARVVRLSGHSHSIDEYLAENVLDRLPERTLTFLLRTALPERLCADLVSALTGEPNGQAMLEEVEAGDLFLRPLDGDRTWFQYHHLFIGFLRRRLRRERGDEVRDLNRRAAGWFAREGMVSEAVDHALAAGDPELAVGIMADQGMALFERSRVATLLSVTDKLPRPLVAASTRIQLTLGWTNCLLQRQDDADRALAEAERTLHLAPATPQRAALALEARLLRACINLYQDRIGDIDEVLAEVLGQAETVDPWLVVAAATIETAVSLSRFDFAAARARQVWAQRFNERLGGPLPGVVGQALAAMAALEQLDVTGAEKHLAHALGRPVVDAGRPAYVNRLAVAQLAALKYHQGDLDAAGEYLDAAGDPDGGVGDLFTSDVVLSRIEASRGDHARARQRLDEGDRLARELRLHRLAAAVFEEQARLGRPGSGPPPQLGGSRGAASDGVRRAVEESLETARIHRGLHSGSAPVACALVPDAVALLARIEEQDRPLAAVRARVLLAATLHRAGESRRAAQCLIPALHACARAGLVSPVVEGGAPIEELLAALTTAEQRDVPAGFLPLLPDRARPPTVHTPIVRDESTGEESTGSAGLPLTGRELQILRLLDAGRSNQQIARTLSLSTNTVKWYLKTLYQKFDVSRRQECVAAARLAHLLP